MFHTKITLVVRNTPAVRRRFGIPSHNTHLSRIDGYYLAWQVGVDGSVREWNFSGKTDLQSNLETFMENYAEGQPVKFVSPEMFLKFAEEIDGPLHKIVLGDTTVHVNEQTYQEVASILNV